MTRREESQEINTKSLLLICPYTPLAKCYQKPEKREPSPAVHACQSFRVQVSWRVSLEGQTEDTQQMPPFPFHSFCSLFSVLPSHINLPIIYRVQGIGLETEKTWKQCVVGSYKSVFPHYSIVSSL